jgi:hypothetical protein
MTAYSDKKGRLLFVGSGLGGDNYGTMYKKSGKWAAPGKHRVKSPALPMRTTKEEAERDLDWYAIEHNLVMVNL